MRDKSIAFQSSVRFDVNRVRAAAVYCSDGRFGDQCDELLHLGLQLPRYDRLALPGGPACLASTFPVYHEEQAVIQHLRFFVKVHRLERVILIAHQDCAFYTEGLHISPEQLEAQQREDLRRSGKRIVSLFEHVAVEAYFARKRSDGFVEFENVR
ncbi:MAG: carbonic anhydrase [Pirellulaceae bacterium]